MKGVKTKNKEIGGKKVRQKKERKERRKEKETNELRKET